MTHTHHDRLTCHRVSCSSAPDSLVLPHSFNVVVFFEIFFKPPDGRVAYFSGGSGIYFWEKVFVVKVLLGEVFFCRFFFG